MPAGADDVSSVVALPASSGSRRPKTLILDVYGRYAAQFRGWLAVSELVHLMGLLGVDEQAVRSAVSRMTRRGLLQPEVRDRVRGYRVTALAEELFADADRRIYASTEPAAVGDGWVLVTFSMPETERDKRHALRSKLTWLGMGNLSSGLWIAPRRILDDVIETVEVLGFEMYVDVFAAAHEGLGAVDELVRRSWDLDELAALYRDFITTYRPVRNGLRRARRPPDGAQAFVSYTLALHQWRKFPYLDPGLPQELLPRGWPGRPALELFSELRAALEPAGFAFAASVIEARTARRNGRR